MERLDVYMSSILAGYASRPRIWDNDEIVERSLRLALLAMNRVDEHLEQQDVEVETEAEVKAKRDRIDGLNECMKRRVDEGVARKEHMNLSWFMNTAKQAGMDHDNKFPSGHEVLELIARYKGLTQE